MHAFKATDPDVSSHNQLTYKLILLDEEEIFETGASLFALNETTGRLTLTQLYDYEKSRKHKFTLGIECSDSVHTARLNVSVLFRDLNDNPPRFERLNQTLVVKESFALGKEMVVLHCVDPDALHGHPFNYSIVHQSPQSEAFSLAGLAGNILVLTKRPAANTTYMVHVRCYDTGSLFSDSFVTVRVTDEASHEPTLAHIHIDVITLESGDVFVKRNETVLGRLSGTDADRSDQLFYDIEHTEESSSLYLGVDKNTGEIRSVHHDLLERQSLQARATVSDRRFVTQANVVSFIY